MADPLIICELINNSREVLSLKPLENISPTEDDSKVIDTEFVYTFNKKVTFTLDETSGNGENEGPEAEETPEVLDEEKANENVLNNLIKQIESVLKDGGDSEDKSILLDELGTHISYINGIVTVYYKYINISEVGPMIDGSLAVEGSFIAGDYGPCSCTVQHSVVDEDSPVPKWNEVCRVEPWNMMMIPSENEGGVKKFMIPLQLSPDYHSGVIRVKIFVDLMKNIPYEEVEDYSSNDTICAISFEKESKLGMKLQEDIEAEKNETDKPTTEEVVTTESNSHDNFVITEIKIATDYDEINAWQQEGYELQCLQIDNQGEICEQDHLWKFFIMAKAEFYRDGLSGIEDVAWVKCLKSLGALPTLAGYDILTDFDLSNADQDYSVYLAVKKGLKPVYNQLAMVCSSIDYEDDFGKWLAKTQGNFRSAPKEMAQILGGPCGVFLYHAFGKTNEIDIVEMDTEDNEEIELDTYDDESGGTLRLQQRLETLQAERDKLQSTNIDLQKKASALMLREKIMQGQSRTLSESAVTDEVNKAEITTKDREDINAEAERQYNDTLILIEEERAKMFKINKEFDQLAVDLQTRLDDKEFKADGISTSFKQFKKEILAKTENSRTGHPISKAEIQYYAQLEQKREEELEKIRLKNISLRTSFRKLERTLRSREQLAEGLHMIDFEQLKIENQTLTEKIDERNNELTKLKRKKTVNVQILTHVREKLRFLEEENKVEKAKLAKLEDQLVSLRSIVAVSKLQRDALRSENKDLKAKQGFATSDLLLTDFQKRKDKLEETKAKVDELMNRYKLLAGYVKERTGTARAITQA